MKKLTCKDLGGPCDQEITGESFEELGQNCQKHVMEQMGAGDAAHVQAVEAWKSQSPEEQQAQMASFEKKYNEAEEI